MIALALAPLWGVGKQEILSANDRVSDAVLCSVVANFQVAVFQIANQMLPLV